MKRLNATEVHARKVEELGLDPTAVDLTSVEAIACALRRVSNFLCPCTAATLVRGVIRPLQGLANNLATLKEVVESTLETMVAHGDFIEQLEVGHGTEYRTMRLLYAAPPSFILRESGLAILLGIASDQLSALPGDLEARIEYVTHVRRLTPHSGEDLRSELFQLGLIELSYAKWIKQPPIESPVQHISCLNKLLDAAAPSIEIPGLFLLDPTRPVRYYRGRWVELKNHSGRYVGRRTQAYGADLWCYAEVERGAPIRFVGLPQKYSVWRGCDEAWRLQAAIDHVRGTPQMFRLRSGPKGTRVIDLFSPVPMWASRRWDAVGERIESSGCLFSYKFGDDEVPEEIDFLKDKLWHVETS